MARSKWDILVERTAARREEWLKLQMELDGLERTKFTANGTGECSACGEVLATEADFAKHFLVSDERYLNLGYCPKRDVETREEKVREDPYV